MSVFSAGINHRSFLWQISALCFVLGLVLAASAFTTQINRSQGGNPNPAFYHGSGSEVATEKYAESENEIKKLREQNTDLENKLAKGSDAAQELNKALQSTKFLAGLMEAVGPGIQVTLNDAPRQDTGASSVEPLNPLSDSLSNIIHDQDIRNVVDELKSSGAEAIAVNGQRVTTLTAIRCVGPVVQINSVPTAPPYVIQAIGSPDGLTTGLNLQGGVLDALRRYNPSMVRIEKKAKLLLPAFAGSTEMRFARMKTTATEGNSRKAGDSQAEKETK